MASLRDHIVRLFGSLRRKRLEQELDDEMQFHLEKLTEKNISAGMEPDDARTAALIAFGRTTQAKDNARDELLHRSFEDVGQDLRYGLRMLRKSPAFAAVAVLSLALGIGANTAVFSVVNAVVLQPLPYPEPARLVNVGVRDDGRERASTASVADFLALTSARSFSSIGAFARIGGGVTLTGRGDAEQIGATVVTSGLLQTLGVPPMIGRVAVPDEDRSGSARVVVLSHRFWNERFGGSPDALGQTLTLDGDLFTIIGVMPPDFALPNQPDDQLWPSLPLDAPDARAPFWLRVYARVAPDVEQAHVDAELASIATSVKERFPNSPPSWKYETQDLKERLVGNADATVLILYAAVALILLMASANVANLSLARATTRLPELALRSALGATRRRIVRQLLIESLLVSVLGGMLGLLLASAGTGFLAASMPGGIPHLREIGIDRWVLAFTAGIALLSGIAIGIVPALHLASDKLGLEIREGSRSGSHGARHRRLATTLIVSEFALALTVLVAAGLAVSSLLRLQRVDVGVRNTSVLVARVSLPTARYREAAKVDAFFDDAMRRVRQQPGVEQVAVSMAVPPHRLMMTNPYTPEGKVYASGERAPVAEELMISPDFFGVLGIPVMRGRVFTDADREGAPGVAIVNETFARQAFPGTDALGRWIQTGDPNPASEKITIIGIVPDVKYSGMEAAPQPTIYVPLKQALWWRSLYMVVRTFGDPLAHVNGVRGAIRDIDPLLALQEVKTMDHLMSESVASPRYLALLLSAFGVLALVLAGAGIYGVLSYLVSQRTRETGIRLALGATTHGVMGLVISDGMRLAFIGVGIGLAIALASTRLLTSILFEVSPLDPLTFTTTALFLLVVGFLACAIPARRASRTDPMIAIRS